MPEFQQSRMDSVEPSSNTDLRGQGQYAMIGGLKMYSETYGKTDRPLVLIPGGMSTIHTSFGKVLPGLAQERQVIAIEQQGHGHTADLDRPLAYHQMAEDTLALLSHIGIDQADFFGYSNGAGVAMEIAIQHPARVRRLVLATPIYAQAGFQPGVLEVVAALQPENLAGSPFEQDYRQTAPNPQDWPKLIEKVKQLDREFVDWTPEAVASIQAPTLLIVGDSDIVRLGHVVEIFRLLGGDVPGDNVGLPKSQLAVFPGTTHITLVDHADWLVPMITRFLDMSLPA